MCHLIVFLKNLSFKCFTEFLLFIYIIIYLHNTDKHESKQRENIKIKY